MIKVKIDSASYHEGRLCLGAVVHGPDGAWMRFARIDVPAHLMTYEIRSAMLESFDQADENEPEQESLF